MQISASIASACKRSAKRRMLANDARSSSANSALHPGCAARARATAASPVARLPTREDHARTGAGQRRRGRFADAGVGAGDDDRAAGEVDDPRPPRPPSCVSRIVRAAVAIAPSVGRREKLHYIAARPARSRQDQWATSVGAPIPYMQRTRDYYAALGYPPYQWAHFDTVPFATPTAPPSRVRASYLLTTAARFDPALGDQGPGAAYNAAAKFYRVYRAPVAPPPDLRISHVGYDRKHTTAADPNTWLPIAALQDAVYARRRRVARERTDRRADRPQPTRDARARCAGRARRVRRPARRCRVARAELSRVPSIRQSRRAASRSERHPNGRDGVRARHRRTRRRAAFSLQRLSARQFRRQTVRSGVAARRRSTQALALFETATAPRTTFVSPQIWTDDPRWKDDYSERRRAAARRTRAAPRRVRATEGRRPARQIRHQGRRR